MAFAEHALDLCLSALSKGNYSQKNGGRFTCAGNI